MTDFIPKFAGFAVTMTAASAVTGGQLVEIVGDYLIQTAGADSAKVVGVASVDAVAGDRLTIFGKGVHQLEAAAAITAGSQVSAGAGGTIVQTAEDAPVLGLALTAATAAGQLVEVSY